ncbi:response regulator transcription factor [Hwanghaeella grinnelliae]|uniref:Response regulator transcription factor n=1 Tax=Hwanghaeella grinnelliae TaxID=2500179 RepID=A0A3S2WPB0_9PROT|nr:response regulator transcription factor [Hwanghaeella grinnelliae]RVU33900.1 response regulator transcription factor [Hwanghaeella grinnelliae]
MRILLVEDNSRIAEHIAACLTKEGMAVDRFGTAEDGALALETVRYDAAILDLGLPDGDGLDVLREARNRGSDTPILILTARDGLKDRVEGLNSGADDYLLKPFEVEELVARLKALMRRPGAVLGMCLTAGNLSFDTVGRDVKVDDKPLRLSRRELDILEYLMRRVGRVVSKEWLEEALYGFDEEVSSNSVEVAVHRLRKSLENAKANVSIHTLRGVGYLLQP